jgi:FkbM family methyltransferase
MGNHASPLTMATDPEHCPPSLQRVVPRRERLQAFLRPLCERLGIPLFSRPGLNGLDREIARRMPQRNGWFVEAGANDGFRQSNTYYLARFRGWRGVLVEPVPHLAAECWKRRPESQVFQCALGALTRAGESLPIRYAGLMSSICGSLGGGVEEEKRAQEGQMIQGIPVQNTVFSVPVRPLTDVLDESHTPPDFDLLSLDVEGYETEVLQGLDLQRYRPKAMCIEVRKENLETVRAMLAPYYEKCTLLRESDHQADCWMERSHA